MNNKTTKYLLQSIGLLPLALASACMQTPQYVDYYENQVNPIFSESGLSSNSEFGNGGDQTITLSGSGFGSDLNGVMVLMGNHNAEVISVTDSEITFKTPTGPITGGPVNLLVGTHTGFLELEHAYTYDVSNLGGEGVDVYADQNGFVQIENLYNSCNGGVSPDFPGCGGFAYIGQTGIKGGAEFYDTTFVYPRLQSASFGFVGGTDVTQGWHVYAPYTSNFPAGIDRLRNSIGTFSIVNPLRENESLCYDVAGGGVPSEDSQCSAESVTQNLGVIDFCEVRDAKKGATGKYAADWSSDHNFFGGVDGANENIAIRLHWNNDAPASTGANVGGGLLPNSRSDVDIVVPAAMIVSAANGYRDSKMWAVTAPNSCLDSSGDGEATLTEDGIVLQWAPIPTDGLPLEGVCDGAGCEVSTSTYVHVSTSRLNMGWFGGDGAGLRASKVVLDTEGYDPETGMSSVGIPNSVLYQFPTPNAQWSKSDNLTKTGYLANINSDASYFLVELYRITDYRIAFSNGETIVFSYVTGDLSFVDFKNPAEATDDCSDCLDNDGDGWVDGVDPDCNEDVGGNGLSEDGSNDVFTCVDGIDNNPQSVDGGGLIDFDDPLCTSGWDGENNCGDGVDNDGDGWVDELDGECSGGALDQEVGQDDPSWECSDGIDNDGDGWIDRMDPVCVSGTVAEDDGTDSTYQCNDGIDNDGDGLIDVDDPQCAGQGGVGQTEEPTFVSRCADGLDNDGDGYIDAVDPDCQYAPYSRETADFHDPTALNKPWSGRVSECYDGIDNDNDGQIDSRDPSCWDPELGFAGNGMFDDESAIHSYSAGTLLHGVNVGGQVSQCLDGIDNDNDGWIDILDPDCFIGGPQEELIQRDGAEAPILGAQNDPLTCLPLLDGQGVAVMGVLPVFGNNQCNDGVDNESSPNGLCDSGESRCIDGRGLSERPF